MIIIGIVGLTFLINAIHMALKISLLMSCWYVIKAVEIIELFYISCSCRM